MSTNDSTTAPPGTVTVKPEEKYVVIWNIASGFNTRIGTKIETEALLSQIFNAGLTGILCFNIKDAILFDSKVVITLKEK